jgi:hypothetical protein
LVIVLLKRKKALPNFGKAFLLAKSKFTSQQK